MIIHTVLLKVAPHVEKEKITEILDRLGNLRHTVLPEIQSFSHGKNCSPEGLNRNYNYGFSMKFLSEKERNHYLQHPEHIKIAQEIMVFLKNGIDSALAFDYAE